MTFDQTCDHELSKGSDLLAVCLKCGTVFEGFLDADGFGAWKPSDRPLKSWDDYVSHDPIPFPPLRLP